MKKFTPDEDERLVTFLRKHRPEPPSEARELEDNLMELVEEDATEVVRGTWVQENPHYLWTVPSAIAAGLLVAWSSFRSLDLQQHQVVESAELETFLATSWNGVVGEVSPPQTSAYPRNDWLLLSNLPSYSPNYIQNVQYQP